VVDDVHLRVMTTRKLPPLSTLQKVLATYIEKDLKRRKRSGKAGGAVEQGLKFGSSTGNTRLSSFGSGPRRARGKTKGRRARARGSVGRLKSPKWAMTELFVLMAYGRKGERAV